MMLEIFNSRGVMETMGQNESVASRIKRIRMQKKIKQSEVASKIDMTQSAYSQLENSKHPGVPKKIKEIADALSVTIGYLLNGEEPEDEKLMNMFSEQYKKRVTMSRLIKYKDIGDSSVEAELVPILKANEEQDFDGDLYTFEMNHKRFAPFLRVGDKVTFNASLKPRGNSPVIYKYDGDTFIGTYSKTRDGYKIEALNNACEDVYKADIVGVIVQVIKMPDLTD